MNRIAYSVVACLIVSLPVRAQEASAPPPHIANFLKRSESSRRGMIEELEFTLRGLRSSGATSPATVRRLAQVEEDLRTLKANREPVVPPLYFPPQVGDIGRLPELKCHVDQVLSEREMLVHVTFPVVIRSVNRFQQQPEKVSHPVSFLVRGLATDRFGEGADVELLDVFEILPRQSFRGDAGRTISLQVLAPFDLERLRPYRAGTAGK